MIKIFRIIPYYTCLIPIVIFTDRSKVVLLLKIRFVIYVLRLSLLYCLICSLHPYGHLLEQV